MRIESVKKTAFLYIVIAGVLWGTSGLFIHFLEPFGFTPLQMTAMRGGVAAAAMAVYVLCKDRSRFRVRGRDFLFFALSGVCVFGTASCYFSSIQASSVSTAVILMYTAPVFVMAFSVAFLGEKLNLPKILSVLLMIAGCALVSGIVGGMRLSLAGILFGLASGIAYSAYNIFTKIEMLHNCNSMSATLYCFIVMGAVSLVFSDPADMLTKMCQKPSVILPLTVGIGICTCFLPYFFYTLALKDIPAGTASALSIIEPMSATVFSILFLKEDIGAASACGIVLILIAVFLLGRSGGEPEEKR